MIPTKNYETVSKFVKVMPRILWTLFYTKYTASWRLFSGSSCYLSLFDRWFTAVCRQRPTRKPCSGRETGGNRTYNTVVKFEIYRNLQLHRVVLPATARFLVSLVLAIMQCRYVSIRSSLEFLLVSSFRFLSLSFSIVLFSRFSSVLVFIILSF